MGHQIMSSLHACIVLFEHGCTPAVVNCVISVRHEGEFASLEISISPNDTVDIGPILVPGLFVQELCIPLASIGRYKERILSSEIRRPHAAAPAAPAAALGTLALLS